MSQLGGFPFVVAALIKDRYDVSDHYDGVHYVGCCVCHRRTWICIAVDDVMDVLLPLYHFHEFHEIWSEILGHCLTTLDVLGGDRDSRDDHDICLLIDVLSLTFVESMINFMDELDDLGFGYARHLHGGAELRFGYPDPRVFYSMNDMVEIRCPFLWHYAPVA